MSWNNSKETRRFKAEQERNKKYYEENGMTDEQIQTMFDYDKAVFLKERNFNETLTALRVEHLEDTDEDELTPFEEIVEPYHDEYDPFEFGFQKEKNGLSACTAFQLHSRSIKVRTMTEQKMIYRCKRLFAGISRTKWIGLL